MMFVSVYLAITEPIVKILSVLGNQTVMLTYAVDREIALKDIIVIAKMGSMVLIVPPIVVLTSSLMTARFVLEMVNVKLQTIVHVSLAFMGKNVKSPLVLG